MTTDFGFSSRGKHLPISLSKRKKISKYWYNREGEYVLFFFPSIATLCIGPLKTFGFNHHAYTCYHTPNPKIISPKKIITDKSKTNLYNSIFKRSPKIQTSCAQTTKITNFKMIILRIPKLLSYTLIVRSPILL